MGCALSCVLTVWDKELLEVLVLETDELIVVPEGAEVGGDAACPAEDFVVLVSVATSSSSALLSFS